MDLTVLVRSCDNSPVDSFQIPEFEEEEISDKKIDPSINFKGFQTLFDNSIITLRITDLSRNFVK